MLTWGESIYKQDGWARGGKRQNTQLFWQQICKWFLWPVFGYNLCLRLSSALNIYLDGVHRWFQFNLLINPQYCICCCFSATLGKKKKKKKLNTSRESSSLHYVQNEFISRYLFRFCNTVVMAFMAFSNIPKWYSRPQLFLAFSLLFLFPYLQDWKLLQILRSSDLPDPTGSFFRSYDRGVIHFVPAIILFYWHLRLSLGRRHIHISSGERSKVWPTPPWSCS